VGEAVSALFTALAWLALACGLVVLGFYAGARSVDAHFRRQSWSETKWLLQWGFYWLAAAVIVVNRVALALS
jgi:hypothetical protein